MAFFQRKRVTIAVGLMVLVAAFLAYLFWPRPDELARWKARMRARGEKFSLAEVAPKYSQEKVDWGKQFQPVIAGILTQPVPPSSVDLMVSVAPGYAVPAWQRPFANETAKTNHTWEALAEQMDKSADAFHQLHM